MFHGTRLPTHASAQICPCLCPSGLASRALLSSAFYYTRNYEIRALDPGVALKPDTYLCSYESVQVIKDKWSQGA